MTHKPNWLKVKPPKGNSYQEIKTMLGSLNLATVCQEAHCPNMGECWKGKHATATFMLMGDTCTRACKFCAVKTGNPKGILDRDEPIKIGEAISKMNLKYVVLTSVDRDDLEDLGAEHFRKTIETIKSNNSSMLVEILTPDFNGRKELIKTVLSAGPDVFAHNIEVVEELTPQVRDRRASYKQSLDVLRIIKELSPTQLTKTSIMLGLGETDEQVQKCLENLREVGCDIVTFGQYLAPTKKSFPVKEYITPEKFKEWEEKANSMGFQYVASGPLVRSSYRAGELFVEKTLRG